MLITEPYRLQQMQMHDEKRYGKSGGKWWARVVDLLEENRCATWLDYGCGTGKLGKYVRNVMRDRQRPLTVNEYDPGVRGKDQVPNGKFDLVTCIDTLEHVEPDCLDEVLTHLAAVTGKLLFAVVSTRHAGKCLPDGRNAHLIVNPADWWLMTLSQPKFLRLRDVWQRQADELDLIAVPR